MSPGLTRRRRATVSRRVLAVPLLFLSATGFSLAGPVAAALDQFLSGASTDALAYADLRSGGLSRGSATVRRAARVGRLAEGTRCLYLTEASRSSVGGFPVGLAASRRVRFELLAAGHDGDARVDLLVDGLPVHRDLPVPARRPEVLRVDLEGALDSRPRRIEARLSEGSRPVAVFGYRVDRADGPAAPFQARLPRASQSTDEDRIPMHEYYPLEVGRSWTYVDRAADDREVTFEVEEHTEMAGTPLARVRRRDRPDEYDLISFRDDRRIWFRASRANGSLDFSDSPVPLSPGRHVKVGDVFQVTPERYRNPVTDAPFRWTVKIQGFRGVRTPAGDFPRCLRVQLEAHETRFGMKVASMDLDLARGVGVVARKGKVTNRDRSTTRFLELLREVRAGSGPGV